MSNLSGIQLRPVPMSAYLVVLRWLGKTVAALWLHAFAGRHRWFAGKEQYAGGAGCGVLMLWLNGWVFHHGPLSSKKRALWTYSSHYSLSSAQKAPFCDKMQDHVWCQFHPLAPLNRIDPALSSLCICIYNYIYDYICICRCICMCICICICICLCICICMCMCMCMGACMHGMDGWMLVCILVCLLVCLLVCYVCMFVRKFVCMYVCMHICMYAYMYAYMFVHLQACMCVCVCVCGLVFFYAILLCLYACMHACMYACMYVCRQGMCVCSVCNVCNKNKAMQRNVMLCHVLYVCMYIIIYIYVCVCVINVINNVCN